MSYITYATAPDSLGVGRQARGVSYETDTGSNWVAEVDAALSSETVIDQATYDTQVSANDTHNAALPPPPAPAPAPDVPAAKRAIYEALGAAAFSPPLAYFVAPFLDALNSNALDIASATLAAAVNATALDATQHNSHHRRAHGERGDAAVKLPHPGLRDRFRIAWAAWGVATAASFAAIEGTALIRYKRADLSLSGQVWSMEHTTPIAWWIFGGALGWLTVHLLRVHGPWG